MERGTCVYHGYLSNCKQKITIGNPIISDYIVQCEIAGLPYVMKTKLTDDDLIDPSLLAEVAVSQRIRNMQDCRGDYVLIAADVFLTLPQEYPPWITSTKAQSGSHQQVGLQKTFSVLYPYAAERSLRRVLKTHPDSLSFRDRKSLFYRIVQGLVLIHEAGILHGDIKSDNILLFEGRPVLADFGLSRPIEVFLDSRHWDVVTLSHRPPEVLLGSHFTVAGEIWSLGCLFYEMMAGHLLISELTPEDQLEKIFRIFGGDDPEVKAKFVSSPKWRVLFQMYSGFNLPPQKSSSSFGPFDLEMLRILRLMMQIDPAKRIDLPSLLGLSWFDDVRENVGGRAEEIQRELPVPLLSSPSQIRRDRRDKLRQMLPLAKRLSIGHWLYGMHISDRTPFRVYLYGLAILESFLLESYWSESPRWIDSEEQVAIYGLAAYTLAQMSVNSPIYYEVVHLRHQPEISRDQLQLAMKHILVVTRFDLYKRNLFTYFKLMQNYFNQRANADS